MVATWTTVCYRRSGVSIGTGADQEIAHGFLDGPLRLELIPLEAGVVFTSCTLTDTDFHVTVTVDKDWAWVVENA